MIQYYNTILLRYCKHISSYCSIIILLSYYTVLLLYSHVLGHFYYISIRLLFAIILLHHGHGLDHLHNTMFAHQDIIVFSLPGMVSTLSVFVRGSRARLCRRRVHGGIRHGRQMRSSNKLYKSVPPPMTPHSRSRKRLWWYDGVMVRIAPEGRGEQPRLPPKSNFGSNARGISSQCPGTHKSATERKPPARARSSDQSSSR